MPFSFKKSIVQPIVKFLAKVKARVASKLPQRPRRTAWERIDDGFMESRWERLRTWWRKR